MPGRLGHLRRGDPPGRPHAVRGSARWHLWHNLAAAVEKTVVAHPACWNTTPSPEGSALAARRRERFTAVHDLLAEGAGLLECTRRLGWALNTVKRYARAERVEELLRPPHYSACLVDLVRPDAPGRVGGLAPGHRETHLGPVGARAVHRHREGGAVGLRNVLAGLEPQGGGRGSRCQRHGQCDHENLHVPQDDPVPASGSRCDVSHYSFSVD